MSNKVYIIDNEFRMKVVNFLKIYGYYDGVLSKNDIQKKYIGGELKLSDIILDKKSFKELKASINVVLDYSIDNHFCEIENVMNYFYKEECLEIRKKFGGLFDRF